MSDQTNGRSEPPGGAGDHHAKVSAGEAPSRRGFLKSSAGFAAGGAAVQVLSQAALAQPAATNPDAELARVQGRRRILLKGGVVLTLDPQLGDFARADVLIEDGKIRDVRPNIAVSEETAAVVDAGNRIVLPGSRIIISIKASCATSSPTVSSTPTTIATSAIR
jgi:hypothetical protein